MRRLAFARWMPLFGALVAFTTEAHADCTPPGGYSTCFDAETLWLRASSSSFLAIDRVDPKAKGTFVLSLSTGYARRPVTVVAASPDPSGREIEVVSDTWNASALATYSPTSSLELSLAVPVVLFQDGNGLAGLTTRDEPDLRRTTLGDPRLGAGYTFIDPERGWGGIVAWLDVVIPLGDDANFSGESGFVLAPSVSAELRADRFSLASLARLRIRDEVAFSGTRIGSQLELAVGAGFDVVAPDLLWIGAEGRALPSLSQQEETTSTGQVFEQTFIPAEWLIVLRTVPWAGEGLTLRAGGGASIPLSSRSPREAQGFSPDEHFAGLTSPAFRFVLSAHYVLDGVHE